MKRKGAGKTLCRADPSILSLQLFSGGHDIDNPSTFRASTFVNLQSILNLLSEIMNSKVCVSCLRAIRRQSRSIVQVSLECNARIDGLSSIHRREMCPHTAHHEPSQRQYREVLRFQGPMQLLRAQPLQWHQSAQKLDRLQLQLRLLTLSR
jgi:hypothetical protein